MSQNNEATDKKTDKKRMRKTLSKRKELETTNMLTKDSGGAYNTPAMYPSP